MQLLDEKDLRNIIVKLDCLTTHLVICLKAAERVLELMDSKKFNDSFCIPLDKMLNIELPALLLAILKNRKNDPPIVRMVMDIRMRRFRDLLKNLVFDYFRVYPDKSLWTFEKFSQVMILPSNIKDQVYEEIGSLFSAEPVTFLSEVFDDVKTVTLEAERASEDWEESE